MNRAGAALAANRSPPPPEPKKGSCLSEIQRLQRDRQERRRLMEQARQERAAEEQRNRDMGTPGDVDFQRMIRNYREREAPAEQAHINPGEMKICICVRKRPISSKEIKRNDYDSVTCLNPLVIVHDCKMKVDGISKYLDNCSFEFDHTFHEDDNTEDIYTFAVQPLIDFVLRGGRGTVFAYGQTGSGKTYTMQGIQSFAAEDLFAALAEFEAQSGQEAYVYVSYFEIYGGRCQDLLNSRQRLNVREDGNGEVVVSDLMELQAESAQALQNIIETGNRNRTTHATESNDESSRSHAICQIALRTMGPGGTEGLLGRLSLIDLAGSERGADTKSHNRQRRLEGAEINKSLLALKECIRALDSNSSHVPYRASKLTLVLKDSFTNRLSRTVMIAAVSPAASSADHTINTLRYADRIKERVVGGQAARNAALAQQQQQDGGPLPGPPAVAPPRAPPQVAAGVGGGGGYDDGSHKGYRGANGGSAPAARMQHNDSEAKLARAQQPVAAQAKGAGYAPRNAAPPPEYDDYDDDLALQDEEAPDEEDEVVQAFHRTVQDLFDEEEDLLNLHMTVIQENAELLTDEGRLLQQMQGDDQDIDGYASRLDSILRRKQELIDILRSKLNDFRKSLQREEVYSQQIAQRQQQHQQQQQQHRGPSSVLPRNSKNS